METKKTESQLDKFIKDVEALQKSQLKEGDGFVLFAYSELNNETQENTFAINGRLNLIAECLYACMKNNPMLANIMIAAGNAIVQGRMIEAGIQAEASAQKEGKKRNKKKLS